MKLNPQKFTLEDFQDQRDWIGKLFSPLNQFLGDVARAFSNQLTVEENLFQEIKEIRWVNVSVHYPLKFRTKFGGSPKGLSVIYLFNNTLASFSTAQPWVVWTYANGEVSISNISGLTSGQTYTIRLHVIYG